MKKFRCAICGFVYDEAAGIPSAGIAPGTKWEDLPEDWTCPICGAPKSVFEEAADAAPAAQAAVPAAADDDGPMRELTAGELSALCSNLARGCEKQYLAEESELFLKLADYFRAKTPREEKADVRELSALVEKDLNEGYPAANAAAGAKKDRGALRALVWSEKVSRMLQSLLARYEKDGGAFLERTNVYVCTVCGFLYVGDTPPELCPVCKVPSWKFAKVEGR